MFRLFLVIGLVIGGINLMSDLYGPAHVAAQERHQSIMSAGY